MRTRRRRSTANGTDETPDGGRRPADDGGGTDVTADAPIDGLYEGSNGRYYTEWQIETRLRTDRWKPCIRQCDSDRRLVETGDGTLLLLVPTDDLPPWTELRIDDRGARVVDTRRPVPSGSIPE